MTDARPTKIRHVVIAVTMLLAVLLYLERACIGVAELFIREDLDLSKGKMAWVMGAFFFAYALGQVPGGWLAQRYGPRLMLTLFMLGLVVFGLMIAVAQNFFMLVLARFLLGASQAGAYPAAAILVKRWVPDRDRGFASSVVAFGGRFGGACANWLTGALIVAFVPWSSPVEFRENDILKLATFVEPSTAKLKEEEKTDHFRKLRSDVREKVAGHKVQDSVIASSVIAEFLPDRNLPDRVDRTKFKLSKDGKEILAIPVEQRTEQEVKRLNRLILEQAFAGSLRQLHERGWRPTLVAYGIVALILAAIYWLVVRDLPVVHSWCNAAERELIVNGQLLSKEDGSKAGFPFRQLLASRNQWICSGFHFFNNIGWVFLITYVATFLAEVYQVPVDERGFLATVPLFFASFGMLAGGKITDVLTRKYGRRIGRMVPMALFKIPCVISLVICPHMATAWGAVIMLTIMSICTDIGVPAAWAFAQDTGGKKAATVLGWVNMWGNLGATLGTFTAPFMDDLRKSNIEELRMISGWDGQLYVCALAFLLSGLCAAFTRADIPLERE